MIHPLSRFTAKSHNAAQDHLISCFGIIIKISVIMCLAAHTFMTNFHMLSLNSVTAPWEEIKKIYLWKSYILMSGYAISLTWRTLVERVLYLESWTREFQINFDFLCEIKCLCISHLIFVWLRHLCCLKINKSLSDFIPRKIMKHFCPRSQELLALAVQ